MAQYIDKAAIVTDIKKYISNYKGILNKVDKSSDEWVDSTLMLESKIDVLQHILSFIDTLEVKEEPVSEDLEEAARKAATWHSRVEGDKFFPNDYQKFIAGAQWQKGNLWKNAQGDDLPEIDREVVVLYQPYQLVGSGDCAVGFAHRPPERWYGRNLDGEEHVFEPKTYDKGEWNIPNVVWWLDLDLPIKGE